MSHTSRSELRRDGTPRTCVLTNDAVLLEVVLRVLVHVAGVQQRLGWDAAHVEARATQGATLLHARNL